MNDLVRKYVEYRRWGLREWSHLLALKILGTISHLKSFNFRLFFNHFHINLMNQFAFQRSLRHSYSLTKLLLTYIFRRLFLGYWISAKNWRAFIIVNLLMFLYEVLLTILKLLFRFLNLLFLDLWHFRNPRRILFLKQLWYNLILVKFWIFVSVFWVLIHKICN